MAIPEINVNNSVDNSLITEANLDAQLSAQDTQLHSNGQPASQDDLLNTFLNSDDLGYSFSASSTLDPE
jgi:hypothetical protein